MIEVLQPAVNKRLTTLEAVKEELHITDTTNDSLLEKLIDQASAMIVRYCHRPFALERYRETLAGYGGPRIMLTMRPVVEIFSVKERGYEITGYKLESPESGILYRAQGWGWNPSLVWDITWHPLANTEGYMYEIEYTAGYKLPGDPDRNLPEDIERACINTVVSWYQGMQYAGSIKSESIGDYSVTYAEPLKVDVTDLLKGWRAVI